MTVLDACVKNGRLSPPHFSAGSATGIIVMQTIIRFRILTALLFAAFVISPGPVLAQSGSAGGSIGNDEKSLSGSRSAPAPDREVAPRRQSHKAEAPRRASRGRGGNGGGGNFDGTWAYTGVGTNCQGTGSGTLVIVGGVATDKHGSAQVSANGAYSGASVGDDGVAMTATGRLSGNSGSGSYRRADGCVGRWTARRL